MCLTYKEGPQIRANGRATQDALEDKAEGPPVSLLEKDGTGEVPPGVGRTWTDARLGASRGGVTTKEPHHLPYVHVAGTNLQHYKSPPSPLSNTPPSGQHTTQEVVVLHSKGEVLPRLALRVGG